MLTAGRVFDVQRFTARSLPELLRNCLSTNSTLHTALQTYRKIIFQVTGLWMHSNGRLFCVYRACTGETRASQVHPLLYLCYYIMRSCLQRSCQHFAAWCTAFSPYVSAIHSLLPDILNKLLSVTVRWLEMKDIVPDEMILLRIYQTRTVGPYTAAVPYRLVFVVNTLRYGFRYGSYRTSTVKYTAGTVYGYGEHP